MPRKLKPHEVGEYRHQRYDVRVPILLDREAKTFFAVFGPQRFEAKSYEEVRVAVHEYVDKALSVEWKPFIRVQSTVISEGMMMRNYDAILGISIERFYIAEKPQVGAVPENRPHTAKLEARWEDLDEGGKERKKDPNDHWHCDTLTRAKDHYEHVGELLLPYSEEKWRALEAIVERVSKATEQLRALLTADDLGKLLEGIAKTLPPALPAPAEKLPESPPLKPEEAVKHIAHFTISDDPETVAHLAALGLLKKEED